MNKIDHNDPLSKSADIVSENIQQLQQLFPEVFKEGKIDWQELQATLGEHIDTENERFNFTWNGKSNARKEAQKPSTGTLRPAPEESVDWDTTQNLYIEGDNLEVLKLLQKSYHQKVKMIYIDPPYNTGKDFVYKDNYKDNLSNYLELTGQTDDEGKKLSTNSDASGRYHSNWLNMMYPRLKLARNLLKDDGVIFISIDDNEVDNLRKLCNEIFGEDNFIECITWNKRIPKNDKGIGNIHEYILIYAKNSNHKHQFTMPKEGIEDINTLLNKLKRSKTSIKDAEIEIKKLYKKKGYDRGITLYNSLDKNYRLWGKINMSWPNSNSFGPTYDVIHPKTKKPVKVPDRGWRWKKETFDEALDYKNIIELHDGTYLCGRIWFDKDENTQPSSILFLDEVDTLLLRSILSMKSDGGIEVEKLFDGKSFFSYPKPTSLITTLLDSQKQASEFEYVLDFFSGSATTAHSVFLDNAENNKSRRFINIQLPEFIDEKNEAFKVGFKTITDIAKERIRRASNKIKKEHPDKVKDLDLGFKVFKLDSSNIKAWSPEAENLEQNLLDAVENIKDGRTENDLLFEILLKYGLDLTLPITEHEIERAKVFNVGAGALLVCLADEITVAVAEGIAELKNKLNPEICRVVFKDNGFKDSAQKTNVMQKLKQHNIEEVRSI